MAAPEDLDPDRNNRTSTNSETLIISSLEDGPREAEPANREDSRRWFNGTLLAGLVLHLFVAFYAALFAPERLDGVLKVMSVTFGTNCTLLGTSLAFYFGTGVLRK